MRRWRIDEMCDNVVSIIQKALSGHSLSLNDALELFHKVDVHSLEMGLLCAAADRLTREKFGGVGEVFSQIGLNYGRCSLECGFCSFGSLESSAKISQVKMMSLTDAVFHAKSLVSQGANGVGLMITADYPLEKFLEIGRAVRASIPKDYPLTANMFDFGPSEARDLIEAGFTSVYHVIRLGEGVDSPISPETRKETLRAAITAGLDVIYCLEPIGPEHTPEVLMENILCAQQYKPISMSTMRRIPVPGTRLALEGQISEIEQCKIQAILTLYCIHWSSIRTMGAHEPSMLFLRSGANHFAAEVGVNPRDQAQETTICGRGHTVAQCAEMLVEAGFTLRKGPSPALQGPLRRN